MFSEISKKRMNLLVHRQKLEQPRGVLMVMQLGSSSGRQGKVVMAIQKIQTKYKAQGLGVKGHKNGSIIL